MNETGNVGTVILADDHNIVRHAVRTILEKRGFEVIGEAGDAESAIELVAEKTPDFLILDLGLPGKSGIEAMYELRERKLIVKTIVLTMFEDESKVRQAISAGARGYVLKTEKPDEFASLLQEALQGRLVLSQRFESNRPELEKIALNGMAEATEDEGDPLGKLSKREREVFFLLADGKPNRIIAKQLFISPRTVETHRARVIKKLGFSSTADLIRFAIRNNLVSL